MINPIDNNLQSNTPVQRKVTATDSGGSQFSLNSAFDKQMEGDGVIYEPSSEKTPEQASSGTPKKSGSFESALKDAGANLHEASAESPDPTSEFANKLWSSISGFFTGLWRNIKKIFGNLWDSKPIGDGLESMNKGQADRTDAPFVKPASESATALSTADTPADSIDSLEKSRDERIRKALADGDKDGFRSLISEEGHKAPARSTSMLTTYNAKGRINEIDPSDENKILHGNRGVRKL